MDVHYFQRYQQEENVHTGNFLLLLSRLYHYSSKKFHSLIGDVVGDELNDFRTEIIFRNQVKGEDSVPDGQIRQAGFNLSVETKLEKNFVLEQIYRHLDSFSGKEDYQIMMTLSPYNLDKEQDMAIKTYIKDKGQKITHVHLTFQEAVKKVREQLDAGRDFEFMDIVYDYESYCANDGLIQDSDNIIRAVAVGATFNDNVRYSMYYDFPSSRPHSYIGLYKQKAIRAIGKRSFILEVIRTENGIEIKGENKHKITDEQRQYILKCATDESKKKTNSEKIADTFFFVDRFYETFFEKKSPHPLLNKKFLKIDEIIKKFEWNTEELAEILKEKTWE